MSNENFDKMIIAVGNAICYISEQETQGGSEHFDELGSAVNALVTLLHAKEAFFSLAIALNSLLIFWCASE